MLTIVILYSPTFVLLGKMEGPFGIQFKHHLNTVPILVVERGEPSCPAPCMPKRAPRRVSLGIVQRLKNEKKLKNEK